MLIMKISSVMIPGALEGRFSIHYGSKPRKIEFAALTSFNITSSNFHWTVSANSSDTNGKPKKESLTTSDGKPITCIILKFEYIGTSSMATGMKLKTFYLRVFDAVVEVSKLFIAIIEEDILRFARIEFVETRDSPLIKDEDEFIIAPKDLNPGDAPGQDCLNRSYYVNKKLNQFDALILKLYSQQGAIGKPSRILLQNYYTLPDSDKKTENGIANSFPTFQDLVDVYQALLHSDPGAQEAALNLLILAEKDKLAKLTSAMNLFIPYITRLDNSIKNHVKTISDIIDLI